MKKSTWVVFAGFVQLLCSLVIVGILTGQIAYGSFFDWEFRMVVFGGVGATTAALGLAGIWCSQRRNGKDDDTLLWAYLWLLFGLLWVGLFFSLAALFCGPQMFSDISRHHWDAIKTRYPQLTAMNNTMAIVAVAQLYTDSLATYGAISVTVAASAVVGIYYTGSLLTWARVRMHALSVLNYFLLALGIAAVVFGFYLLSHKPMYGNTFWTPLLFFCIAWLTVVSAIIGMCTVTAKNERKDSCLGTYIVSVSVVLAFCVAFCVFCLLYANEMADSFNDVPDRIFANITGGAGLSGVWTRDDFKSILLSNFKYLVTYATVMAVALCAGLAAASVQYRDKQSQYIPVPTDDNMRGNV